MVEIDALLVLRVDQFGVENVYSIDDFRLSVASLYNNLLSVWLKEEINYMRSFTVKVNIVALVKQVIEGE